MKLHKKIQTCGLIALSVLTLAGCKDDNIQRAYTLDATMEQLQDADNNGAKVRLYNEQWTYWEGGDRITLRGNSSVGQAEGWLVGSSSDYEDYNGVFATTLEEIGGTASKWFVALFPASDDHVIAYNAGGENKGFSARIHLEESQHYRDDSSYARDVLPMVAWYGGREWGPDPSTQDPNPPRLDFHSLAGIVRLQLLNGTNETRHISSIVLTSVAGNGATAKRLHGNFPIRNLYNYNAFLDDSVYTSGDDNQLSLDMSQASGGSLEFAPNDLKSFYIVLPAFHGMDTSSYYRLQMTVNTTEGTAFTKTFSAHTRRNGITYLRAINVTNFNSGPSNNATLVGNGTSTRPFKIYTLNDLVYVRSCFANPVGGKVYVNGQEVTANTWFRIMRSDINLSPSVWNDGGISNFTGHMTYYANVSNYHDTTALTGITNNSTHPLFESIGANGVVDGLAIRCDSTISIGGNYSPLCGTNNGKIINCHTGKQAAGRDPYVGSITSFSGICAINNASGLIEGCGCSYQGRISNTAKFAGICNNNYGTIRGCYAASPMDVTGPTTAAGVCHDNNGTVEDCYFAARINSGTRWAGIVYNNTSGHTVQHCYFGDGSILFADTVAGIVSFNNGTVDYCWGNGNLRGDKVGGIAATVGATGKLTNCFINDSAFYLTIRSTGTRHLGGGLAAEVMGGGSIRNSYVVMNNFMHPAGSAFGAVVGHIRTGGTIDNCYGLMDSTVVTPRFYGTTQAAESALGTIFTHCHLVSGTQIGVNRIYAKNTTDGTLNDLSELLTDLNTNRGTYVEWERINSGNNTAPQLKAYSRPTSKYFRPAKHRR